MFKRSTPVVSSDDFARMGRWLRCLPLAGSVDRGFCGFSNGDSSLEDRSVSTRLTVKQIRFDMPHLVIETNTH